ncbi:MAG: YbhN family protein [Halorhabdus sp.]
MRFRHVTASIAGFIAAVGILVVLATLVGTDDLLSAIARSREQYVALVGAAIITWLCCWGLALGVVMSAVGTSIPPGEAILINAGTAFANHVTPFGQAGGETLGAWLLADTSGENFERCLAAMTSFDTINVVPSLTFASVGLAYYASITRLNGRLSLLPVALVTFVGGFVVIVGFVLRRSDATETLLHRVTTPLIRVTTRILPGIKERGVEAIEHQISGFMDGIRRVSHDRNRLALALGLSTLGWGSQAVGLWTAFYALSAPIPVYVPLFVLPLGAVASVLPTPGGLGGIEAVQIALLVAATAVAPPTIAAAVAISSVGGYFLTTTLGAGAIAVLKLR